MAPGPYSARVAGSRDAPIDPAGGSDDVDAIVAAWSRERPDLDVEPLQVLSRITRLAHHVDLARATAFARHALDRWEFDVLAALRRAGSPYQLSPSALAAANFVTSGTMTNRVDRLTDRGFVRRRPDPRDGRAVIVALTDAGRRSVDAAMSDLLDAEHALLTDLPPEDLTELAGKLRRLLAVFET